MVLTRIEPIDQFVLHRVTMVLCVGVSLWGIVYNLRVYVNLDEHVQWLDWRLWIGGLKLSVVHYKYPAISQPGSS